MNRGHSEDRNRLSWWFPKLPSDILVPPTVIIPYTGLDLVNILDGEIPPEFDSLCSQIENAGNQLGWPLFLRTDYFSSKHSWKDTCHVREPECVGKQVIRLVQESIMADAIGLPTDCWIVRKLIPTTPAFFAFHGKMPIVKERRYFVQNDQVTCHHPYWPMKAFVFGDFSDQVPNWEELFTAMNIEDADEVDLLSGLSGKVGAELGGAWSVDWLWCEDEGEWYLTDMAEASQSYHWPECPVGDRV